METLQKAKVMKHLLIITAACWCMLLAACSRGFDPVDYGKDACAHCRMTIVDHRYAAELVTEKGRAYKFDDLQCMRQLMAAEKPQGHSLLFVESYLGQPNAPLDATKAVYLKHEFFATPMNGHYAAFASAADAQSFMDSLNIPALRWEELE